MVFCSIVVGGGIGFDPVKFGDEIGWAPTSVWKRNERIKVFGNDIIPHAEWIYEECIDEDKSVSEVLSSLIKSEIISLEKLAKSSTKSDLSMTLVIKRDKKDISGAIDLDASLLKALGKLGFSLCVNIK